MLRCVAAFSKAYQQLRGQALGQSSHYRKAKVTHSVSAFVKEFAPKATNSVPLEEEAAVAGRVSAIRTSGKKLHFLDVESQGSKLQFIVNKEFSKEAESASQLRRGDIILGVGKPTRTKAGELSLLCSAHSLLSPCLHMLPQPESLTCPETRQRQRYLDLLTNRQTMRLFQDRHRLVAELKSQFARAGFVEVETPILQGEAGGANARPFQTKLVETGMNLFLRVSPELNLKCLLVGGMERVVQFGKSFRNQGIDQTHNPEFTMAEAYAAYWDYQQMMAFTGTLLTKLAEGFGKPGVSWERVEYLPRLQDLTSTTFDFLGTEAAIPKLLEVFEARKLPVPAIKTEPHLLDKLCSQVLQPTLPPYAFLVHQPRVISPLARPRDHLTSQRFELFVHGRQIANGYSELTDPNLQELNFNLQSQLKGQDAEAMTANEQFVSALRHGLPPCAGLGIGVDRLAMWLLDKTSIQEVLLFPLMKHK